MTLLVRTFDDLNDVRARVSRIITLFSGGLDSTYLLYRLQRAGFTDVTALCVDLGADVDRSLLQRTVEYFGYRFTFRDRKQEFVSDFVRPAIAAQAMYLGLYPISSSLSRPLMAKCAVDEAQDIRAEAILHTANRSQNSLRRLNTAIRNLGYGGIYGSPYEYCPLSREEKIRELFAAGIDGAIAGRSHSSDENLWCREFESGDLEDPESFTIAPALYHWTRPAATDCPLDLQITYREGVPTALNGQAMELIDMIRELNAIVGAHGLGRYLGLEHLDKGEKVLEVREMPAAMALLTAYRHMENACVDVDTIREKLSLEQIWVREAIEGRWYSTLRQSCGAFIATVAREVNGTIGLSVDKSGMRITSMRADRPLYIRDRHAWEMASTAQALTSPQSHHDNTFLEATIGNATDRATGR